MISELDVAVGVHPAPHTHYLFNEPHLKTTWAHSKTVTGEEQEGLSVTANKRARFQEESLAHRLRLHRKTGEEVPGWEQCGAQPVRDAADGRMQGGGR